MILLENVSLKPYNTFNIEVKAKYFTSLENDADIVAFCELLQNKQDKFLILGGGSNVLFTSDFEGYVGKINTKGIDIVDDNEEYIIIKAQSGVVWDELVQLTVENEWYGLENLSLIPGNVGSSPIQNIGAYGIEIKDVLHQLEAIHIQSLQKQIFSNSQCHFAYRDSIFKNELKSQYVITSVSFKLRKKKNLNIEYGAIAQELKKKSIVNPSIKDIREIICEIRTAKLPDYNKIGNSGSFFKNPSINSSFYNILLQTHKEIAAYKQDNNTFKLSAAWLIEQCGWKGYRNGDIGVYDKQALVLVNYGNARGEDIFILSKKIIDSVFKKFGIYLEREVNIF